MTMNPLLSEMVTGTMPCATIVHSCLFLKFVKSYSTVIYEEKAITLSEVKHTMCST